MLKEIEELYSKHGIKARGIIHVGAHEGHEYKDYLLAGIRDMMFFEPVKSNFDLLLETIKDSDSRVRCFNMALGNETGDREMFVETANRGMSCSMLEPARHRELYPWIVFDEREVVQIDKLDNIEFDRKIYNILNIDVQGFELEVLKGSTRTLRYIDAVFCEVNRVEVYKDCALTLDIDIFLAKYDFSRVSDDPMDSWGDAVYIKNKFLNINYIV